jgi:hypothetical protein
MNMRRDKAGNATRMNANANIDRRISKVRMAR